MDGDRVVAWSTVAVISIVIVGIFFLFQVSGCADAAPGEGESTCTSGPAIGVPGLWTVAVIGAAVVVTSVWQILRALRGR